MKELYEKDLEEAKKDVKNSISEDFPIIQLVNHIEDMDKIIKVKLDWLKMVLNDAILSFKIGFYHLSALCKVPSIPFEILNDIFLQ